MKRAILEHLRNPETFLLLTKEHPPVISLGDFGFRCGSCIYFHHQNYQELILPNLSILIEILPTHKINNIYVNERLVYRELCSKNS